MRATLFAGLLLHGPMSLAAQGAAATCQAPRAALTAAIEKVARKQRNIGLSAAIWHDDRLLFSVGLGWSNRETKTAVVPATRFKIASLTKAFTGVALLKLAEQGTIELDAPVRRYVPEFPEKDAPVTIRRLAAHLAGLPHWGPERDELYRRKFDDPVELLPFYAAKPLVRGAGRKYNYSSYGYNLIALAMQRAARRPFREYVTQTVIAPMALSQTAFESGDPRRDRIAAAYSFYDLKTFVELSEAIRVPVLDTSHNMGGGSMYSTAEDLVRFGARLLKPGYLSPRSYALLYTRPTIDRVTSPTSFGFTVNAPGAEERLSLTGSNPGVQAGWLIYPRRKLVVALVANTWGIGSRSGELISDLPGRLADLCVPLPKSDRR